MKTPPTQKSSGANSAGPRAVASLEAQPAAGRDLSDQSDSWLITRACRQRPDLEALDALIDRHWKPLFAHCQLLAGNPTRAARLARAAWRRFLQAPPALHFAEDFRSHLILTASRLWREQTQPPPSAGSPAAPRDVSPQVLQFVEAAGGITFTGARVADLESLSEEEQIRLQRQIDAALAQLAPQDRLALLSRCLNGHSSAATSPRPDRAACAH